MTFLILILSLSLIVIAVMNWLTRRKLNRMQKVHDETRLFIIYGNKQGQAILHELDSMKKGILVAFRFLKKDHNEINTRLDKVKANTDSIKFRVDKIDIEKTKQILTPKVVKTINRIMKHNEGKWMSMPKVSVIRKNRTTGTIKGKVKYSNLWGYLKEDMK